jgi:hypothetical protein
LSIWGQQRFCGCRNFRQSDGCYQAAGRQFVRLPGHRGVWVGQASDTVDYYFSSCLNYRVDR